VPEHRVHRRSVGFLDREGDRWACFLVTFPDGTGVWRGQLAFRPSDGQGGDDEVVTTEIFVEASEGEIHQKARGLGRPLLGALLDSALHIRDRARHSSPFLQRWFTRLLAESGLPSSLGDGPLIEGALAGDAERTSSELDQLQSLYASYRMDQVAHLIALVHPDDFQRAVEELLDGQSIDFAARDRLQLAMLVVEQLESLLPLPPFEVWVGDFLSHRDEYSRYAHALHRQGILP
jgi:hypothetical protein